MSNKSKFTFERFIYLMGFVGVVFIFSGIVISVRFEQGLAYHARTLSGLAYGLGHACLLLAALLFCFYPLMSRFTKK